MSDEIDRGFCVPYSRLSYRRKLIRTLWVALVIPFLFFVPADTRVLGLSRDVWIVAAIVSSIVQAVYTFRMWMRGRGNENGRKAAQPGATDNPDDAQRLREDH